MSDDSEQSGGGVCLPRRSGNPRRRESARASTPMRRRCFSPAIARSRSSAPCAFRFSIIPRSISAKRPARPSCRSTRPTRRKSIVASCRSRATQTESFAIGGPGTPVEWAVEMQRFDEQRTLDHLAGEIDEALADALGRAVAAAHAKTPVGRRRNLDRRARRLHRRARRSLPAISGYFSRRRERNAGAIKAAPPTNALSRCCASAPARFRTAHSRRPSSRQHRADRRQAGAVRRHRIQRHHRVRRRLLRPRISADGPAGARACTRRQCGAQPLPHADAARSRDLDALATLPFFLSMRAAIRARVTAARLERAKAL